MKKQLIILLTSVFLVQLTFAQETQSYTAEEAYQLIKTIEPVPFTQTTDPGAQWFPEAGAALFMHWGIHSVGALNPSWAMIKNCFWVKYDCPVPEVDYYRLANEFNPQNYDPEKWVLAAKEAGFQYMVLTAKHHDGYCLWPSKYSNWNTGIYMEGRDLLKPYVEACRKYGMKVGFYFSPRDWGSDKYRFPFKDFDLNQKWDLPEISQQENQEKYDIFFDMVVGQLSELLTRYGKIDLLWLDGIEWQNVDTYPDKIHAWFRAIQPSMVINPRWDTNDDNKSFGDYVAEEDSWRDHLTEAPVKEGQWWEFCESWSGHWGYSPTEKFRSIEQVIKHLVYARSFGGNLLINIGPAPDGTMRPGFYDECNKLAGWMKNNKESVIGTQAVMNWKNMSNYPMTRNGNDLYVHLLNDTVPSLEISGIEKPAKVIFLETGEELSYIFKKGNLKIELEEQQSHPWDAVLKLCYK